MKILIAIILLIGLVSNTMGASCEGLVDDIKGIQKKQYELKQNDSSKNLASLEQDLNAQMTELEVLKEIKNLRKKYIDSTSTLSRPSLIRDTKEALLEKIKVTTNVIMMERAIKQVWEKAPTFFNTYGGANKSLDEFIQTISSETSAPDTTIKDKETFHVLITAICKDLDQRSLPCGKNARTKEIIHNLFDVYNTTNDTDKEEKKTQYLNLLKRDLPNSNQLEDELEESQLLADLIDQSLSSPESFTQQDDLNTALTNYQGKMEQILDEINVDKDNASTARKVYAQFKDELQNDLDQANLANTDNIEKLRQQKLADHLENFEKKLGSSFQALKQENKLNKIISNLGMNSDNNRNNRTIIHDVFANLGVTECSTIYRITAPQTQLEKFDECMQALSASEKVEDNITAKKDSMRDLQNQIATVKATDSFNEMEKLKTALLKETKQNCTTEEFSQTNDTIKVCTDGTIDGCMSNNMRSIEILGEVIAEVEKRIGYTSDGTTNIARACQGESAKALAPSTCRGAIDKTIVLKQYDTYYNGNKDLGKKKGFGNILNGALAAQLPSSTMNLLYWKYNAPMQYDGLYNQAIWNKQQLHYSTQWGELQNNWIDMNGGTNTWSKDWYYDFSSQSYTPNYY